MAARIAVNRLCLGCRQTLNRQLSHGYATTSGRPPPLPHLSPAPEAGFRPWQETVRDWRLYLCLFGFVGTTGMIYSGLEGPKVTEKAYMDISIDGQYAGRLVIGLFGRYNPETVENFRGLIEHSPGYGYRGAPFHGVIRNYMVIGGDFQRGDGTGGASIHLTSDFCAENRRGTPLRGYLCMVADENRRVRSQFYILCNGAPHLDKEAVAFGKVLQGMELVDAISNLPVDDKQRPIRRVAIQDCGMLREGEAPTQRLASS